MGIMSVKSRGGVMSATVLAVACAILVHSAQGAMGGGGGVDAEMANYCREEYGSLSFYDEMADQCLCMQGSTFDGRR